MAESATSLLSTDSAPSSAPRSPSMPVPAVPRRAAPPRRKAPKSPSPVPSPQVLEGDIASQSPVATPLAEEDAKSRVLQEDVQKSKEDEVALGLAEPPPVPPPTMAVTNEGQHRDKTAKDAEAAAYASALTSALEDVQAQESSLDTELMEHEQVPVARLDLAEPEESGQLEQSSSSAEAPAAESEQEEEEDAATRRARIAERLRQQGEFNPFSAPSS